MTALNKILRQAMRTSIARFISIAGHPFILVPLLIFLPRYRSNSNGAIRVALLFAAIVFIPMSILIWRSVASGRAGSEAGGGAKTAADSSPAGRVTDETGYFRFADQPEVVGSNHAKGLVLLKICRTYQDLAKV
jgi:hypothetical protein